MKYKRGSNPLGEGEFWVEIDEEGRVSRALWLRNGGKHQVLDGDLYKAVAGVCNVIAMQTEEDRFELAWESASKRPDPSYMTKR